MHAIEKILARAAGVPAVRTGEIANCAVDLAGINDLYLQTVRSFFEMGGTKVHDPDKIIMFLDHYAPASTIAQADNQKQFREFCRSQGIDLLMDVDQGVCHQVLADKGLVYPGQVLVVTDSHTTTHGAFGAFGTGVGATDLATIMITGKLWFRVPEIIRITLTGAMRPGVYAKDVILKIIGQLKADYAVYKAVEFAGPAVAGLSVSERMALCNMTTEMGAKACYIQPDAVTMAYLDSKGLQPDRMVATDPDFVYAAEHTYDVSGIGPQVSVPFSVDNVADIAVHAGKPVDQAFLGTCTGGRVEDLAVAARILAGRHIHPHTRMLVVPASKAVFLEAMDKGYVQSLVQAGATFVTPGCAACLGTHEGLLALGERCISTSNRNFPGRMGHGQAEIFLASPAAVAASALEGRITDPTTFLAQEHRSC
jgi:homoaconitate hydratase family protein